MRDSFIANTSRFRPIEDEKSDARYRDLLGYRTLDYFVLSESGLRELCGDYDSRVILRELKNQDLLWHDKDRLTHKCPAIPSLGHARPNLHWISVKLIGEQERGEVEKYREEGVEF